jgi:hypothetical protein
MTATTSDELEVGKEWFCNMFDVFSPFNWTNEENYGISAQSVSAFRFNSGAQRMRNMNKN